MAREIEAEPAREETLTHPQHRHWKITVEAPNGLRTVVVATELDVDMAYKPVDNILQLYVRPVIANLYNRKNEANPHG